MDFTDLVRQASKGDVSAFVTLTRRFQHLAFGSALALVHDFQAAEDVTQDAFLAVWSALPRLISSRSHSLCPSDIRNSPDHTSR